jgi:hypothetical protein
MDSQATLKLKKPSKLKTLVRMQFQQKMDVSAQKDKKAVLFKTLYTVLGFILATAVLFFVFYIGAFLNVLSLSRTIPDYVLIFLVTVMQLISILSCTYGLMKSFYFSQDNPLLLTFPVMANEVFLSKLIVYYLLELKRSFTFLLPIFIAYGINNYIMDGLTGGDILYFHCISVFPCTFSDTYCTRRDIIHSCYGIIYAAPSIQVAVDDTLHSDRNYAYDSCVLRGIKDSRGLQYC